MKPVLFFLSLSCIWVTTAAAQITLNGSLLTDAEKPVPDTKIGVAGGPSNITDSKGQFSFKLSLDFIEGERVILSVYKKDWVINHPLDGEWNLPNLKLQNVQYTKVIIVPKGSKALWTHARIEKHIALLSDEIAKLKKEGETPRPVDFSYYLSEWANKYGFTPEQVTAAFDQWANEVKNSEDSRTLGLRAFYQKNFAAAAESFEKAAKQGEVRLKNLQEEVRWQMVQTYNDWKLAGNSLANLYQFELALTKYDSASKLVPKANFPQEWAEIRIFTGNAKEEIGIRVEGERAILLLKESERDYHEAFEIYTREQWPQDWAKTQNNLGIVLGELGMRTGGEEGEKLLARAVTAYENALQVYTRDQFPQDWAKTQNNLGNVLSDLGTRRSGEEGAKCLTQAVTAYENALQVYTRAELPQHWAGTQNNLVSVLIELSAHMSCEEGAKWLVQAVRACENALQVCTRTQMPQEWASIQYNLGNALIVRGTCMGGEEGAKWLVQAMTAYKNALQIFTRTQMPQQWAGMQNGLGNAFWNLGKRMRGDEGVKWLLQAVAAYENALQVYTQAQLPQNWAMTQNNLGNVFRELGVRRGGEERAKWLVQAVRAYENALQVRSFEYLPIDWAQTQTDLAELYTLLEDWPNVAACYANVLKVYPDYDEAYQTASYLYHEVLHQFPGDYASAFTLNQTWLAHHPDDLSAQCGFAEKHFTTGRFGECEQRLAGLLENSEVSTSTKIALRAIQIANFVGLGQTKQVPANLETLQQAIATQPDTFKVHWTFEGTKHFISQNEKLASYREWLLQLFAAMEIKEGREAILAALREVRKKFNVAK